MDEDQIIASGLQSIRLGIVNSDWNLVCEGYNNISGENLFPNEEKVSRLENIRRLLKPAEEEHNTTISDLKKSLKEHGIKENELKNKNKKDLMKLLEDVGKISSELNNNFKILEQNQKGGDKFGKGKIQIISDPYNPILAKKNQIINKGKHKMPKKPRVGMPEDNSNDESAGVRFHNVNKPPPNRQ